MATPQTNNVEMETTKKTRRKFSLTRKDAIMEKAKRIGKRKTADEEGIGYNLLKRWFRQKDQLNKFASTRGGGEGGVTTNTTDSSCCIRSRLDGGGRPPLIKTTIENELCEWFDTMQDEVTTTTLTADGGCHVKINIPLCIAKVRQLDDSLQQVNEVVLRRRIWRIFKRRQIMERTITQYQHHQQKTRACTAIIEGWAKYMKEKMNMLGITHANICNFNEINVFFSPHSTNAEPIQQRCTVMIGVTGDGDGFPPYIVFKGNDSERGLIYLQLQRVMAARYEMEEYEGYPTSNYYAVQENAWMNSELVVDWINLVFRPWAETKVGPTMLLLDEFSEHMTDEVRDAVADCGAFLEFIPGGYTRQLQVMDVGINKTFKDVVRDEHDEWSFRTNFGTKPQREDVAAWIKTAYDCIKPRTITKAWARVGLPYPLTINNNNNNDVTINEEANKDDDSDEEFDSFVDYLQLRTLAIDDRTEEEVETDNYYNDDDGSM